MKTTFKFPVTKTAVVVWYRDGQRHEQVIDTPANNESLKNLMVMKHKVGFNEIRAVKADPNGVLTTTQGINPMALAAAMMMV